MGLSIMKKIIQVMLFSFLFSMLSEHAYSAIDHFKEQHDMAVAFLKDYERDSQITILKKFESQKSDLRYKAGLFEIGNYLAIYFFACTFMEFIMKTTPEEKYVATVLGCFCLIGSNYCKMKQRESIQRLDQIQALQNQSDQFGKSDQSRFCKSYENKVQYYSDSV